MAVARRFMLRVPTSDATVTEWWEAQDNPSVSVRTLIREQVERFGFIDSATRPVSVPTGTPVPVASPAPLVVDSAPREPFVGPVASVTASLVEAAPVATIPTPASATVPAPEASRPRRGLPTVAPAVPTLAPVPAPAASLSTPVPAQAPTTHPAAVAAAGPQSVDPAGQVDMDDIFGHGQKS